MNVINKVIKYCPFCKSEKYKILAVEAKIEDIVYEQGFIIEKAIVGRWYKAECEECKNFFKAYIKIEEEIGKKRRGSFYIPFDEPQKGEPI